MCITVFGERSERVESAFRHVWRADERLDHGDHGPHPFGCWAHTFIDCALRGKDRLDL